MVPMAVPIRSLEARYQHVRAEGSNHAHNVAQGDVMALPLLKGLIRVLRKAEVRDASEALFHSVVAVGRGQFQRAQHAQHIKKIAAHLVLAALAPIQSEQQYAIAVAAGLEGHHPAVFIVRMGRGMHQAGRGAQTAQHQLQASGAGILRKGIERPDFAAVILRRR